MIKTFCDRPFARFRTKVELLFGQIFHQKGFLFQGLLEQVILKHPKLDLVIANAGIDIPQHIETMDWRVVEKHYQIHTLSNHVLMQVLAPFFINKGRGHVAVTISMAALSGGFPYETAYSGSKAAMSGWTRTLQAEWDGTGITVTEYLPGLIATELGTASAQASGLELPASDTFQDEEQSFVTRLFSPLDPMRVAEQIVGCVRRPRAVLYSTLGTHVLCWFMQFAGLRRRLAAGMGRSSRKGFGLPVFGRPLPEQDETQSGAGAS